MKKFVNLKLYSMLSYDIDNLNWTSLDDSIRLLDKTETSIVSFTDFNLFKSSFYNNVVKKNEELKTNLIIFPGTELHFVDDTIDFRCLFIFDNKTDDQNLENLQNIITDYCSKKQNKINDLIKLLNGFKFEIVLDLNNSNKIDIKFIKKIKSKIRYAIFSDNSKKRFETLIKDLVNENITLLFDDEDNNWAKIDKSLNFVEVEDENKLDFDFIFANIKCEKIID